MPIFGISEYICTFINDVQLRPNCDVIISKCEAEDFLKSSKPVLETMSARYYELSLTSSKATGYTEEVILSDFFINLLNEDIQPYAILGGINTERTHKSNVETTNYSKDETYTAEQTPITGESQIQNMGLAVFNGDKLVGELTGLDCICHLIVTNQLDTATVSIPSPFEDEETIALEIALTKPSSKSVKLINNYPFIETNAYITARVMSLSNGLDFTKEENLTKLEEYANNYLESSISSYLYKTSKEFNSDIVRFWKRNEK